VAPTAYTVSTLRMLARFFHMQGNTSAYETRVEIPGQYTRLHRCIRSLVGREVCMQIHRVLSIKYSTQGDHVLSPTPPLDARLFIATRYVSRVAKRECPPPALAAVSTASTPYPSLISALHPGDYRSL